jgi:hypothetical protein
MAESLMCVNQREPEVFLGEACQSIADSYCETAFTPNARIEAMRTGISAVAN